MFRSISHFLGKLLGSLVGEVPAESARCEYICSKLACPPELFATCKKRQDYQAAERDN
jgi:hypothetical protein